MPLKYQTQAVAQLAGDSLLRKVHELRLLIALRESDFTDLTDYCGRSDPSFGVFPVAPAAVQTLHRATLGASYSHHPTLARLGDQYAVFWACGLRHEDRAGQFVRCALSADLQHWRPGIAPAPIGSASDRVWFVNGACCTDGRLYLYAACWQPGADEMGLRVFVTQDLEHWEDAGEISQPYCLREGPRRTPTGDLLAAGFALGSNERCVALRWPKGADPASPPQQVPLPASPSGVRPENGSWYALEDGRLVMLLRDGGLSLRLGLTISEDGGQTWSPPVLSNFPNTYSRMHCGRLSDGRTYILGNNFGHCLDRTRLFLAISDDGLYYQRMYTLRDQPPPRRFHGYNKDLGFAYPNVLVEPDRLIAVYSVNKEDVEVAVVPTAGL